MKRTSHLHVVKSLELTSKIVQGHDQIQQDKDQIKQEEAVGVEAITDPETEANADPGHNVSRGDHKDKRIGKQLTISTVISDRHIRDANHRVIDTSQNQEKSDGGGK